VSSQDIGPLEAFPEGKVRVVKAGRREIGVTCWRGRLYAVSNVCAHQRGPVCRGWLSPRLTATEPGRMEVEDEAPVIACPWHGWEFDMRSGRALSDERYALRTYPVRVEQGRVVLELGP
jgi:nitrite reductase (NADH) small subunit